MTAKQLFEYSLIELSKVNAPSMLLQDYNYYINKAINLYINKRYNIYDTNQQTTDDLRVLKSTAILDVAKTESYDEVSNMGAGLAKLFSGFFEVNLPDDYLHMLNCICIYRLNKRHKCYNQGDYVQFAAKRLTSDAWSTILADLYNQPKPWQPYYFIHNVNTSSDLPTNPVKTDDEGFIVSGTDDQDGIYDYRLKSLVSHTGTEDGTESPDDDFTDSKSEGESNFPRKVKIGLNTRDDNFVEREAGQRYGNTSKVRCEIRYGRDTSVFKLVKVLADYIKAPLIIRLTQEQVDLTEDTSLILEYPDYVCQEIVNELVTLVMEATADPRLLTNMQVNQSIANPAQQLAPQPQQQRRG